MRWGFAFSLKDVVSSSWFTGIAAQLIFEFVSKIKEKIGKYIIQRSVFDSVF